MVLQNFLDSIRLTFFWAPWLFLEPVALARPQHRTIMVFVTNPLIGNVPNF